MRVAEFLKFRAHIKGVPRRERKNRVAEVMGKTQLVDRAHQIIGNLSKGFKQRVGIADALVGNPRLLILDEPTIGLDPLQVRQVYDLIKELAHDRTVILSTHILPDVEMICNKVVIIHQGITVASDSIGSLIEHYDDYAIELTLEKNGCSRPSIMDKLRSIDGVKEIEGGQSEAAQDTLIFRMIPNERRDLRGHLFAMAKEQGWKLLELRREKISLENVFTRLTSSAEQAQSQRTLEAGPASSPAKEQLESAAVVEQQPKVEAESEAEPEANADKSETTEEQQSGSDEQSSKPDSDREEA
jgi:ABC-2 type transport system ATP-binding protein